jgi:hypothetical protein
MTTRNFGYSHDKPPALAGLTVIDTEFKPIGKVTDVLYDELEQTPRWAVVQTGLLRNERYLPLADSYLDEGDRLVVPHNKMSIKHAPRARRDHVVTREVARELRDYYGAAA